MRGLGNKTKHKKQKYRTRQNIITLSQNNSFRNFFCCKARTFSYRKFSAALTFFLLSPKFHIFQDQTEICMPVKKNCQKLPPRVFGLRRKDATTSDRKINDLSYKCDQKYVTFMSKVSPFKSVSGVSRRDVVMNPFIF